MRKAWSYSAEGIGGADGQMPLKSDGTEWPWPSTGTMRFDTLNRLTISRLFAARSHIAKLLVAQAVFLVAVSCFHRFGRLELADQRMTTTVYSGLCLRFCKKSHTSRRPALTSTDDLSVTRGEMQNGRQT